MRDELNPSSYPMRDSPTCEMCSVYLRSVGSSERYVDGTSLVLFCSTGCKEQYIGEQ